MRLYDLEQSGSQSEASLKGWVIDEQMMQNWSTP